MFIRVGWGFSKTQVDPSKMLTIFWRAPYITYIDLHSPDRKYSGWGLLTRHIAVEFMASLNNILVVDLECSGRIQHV